MAHAGAPKVTRPSVDGVLVRARLFDRLATSTARAIWVAAAPGSGKTSLAASWCRAVGGCTLWTQADADDADPASFLHGLRDAAVAAGVARASRLPVLPVDQGSELAPFVRRWFRGLYALLPAGTLWVVDNVHEAEGPAMATVLREAVDELPDGMRLLVLGLSDAPPELARAQANGVVDVLGDDDLRFTRAESDDVVLARIVADERLRAELHEQSAGWAAGLVLMTEQLRRRRPLRMPSASDSQAAVFDYFAAEVMAGITRHDQLALMSTALLPHVTGRLAQAACGRRGLEALLERLSSRHLFVHRQPDEEPTYQYHSLFRAYLLARSRMELAPGVLNAATERAAALLEVDGDIEAAVTLYLAVSCWPAAARLIVGHARHWHARGRWRTLVQRIAALPPALLDDEPWLAYWLGASQVWSTPVPARQALEQAYDGFAAAGDTTGQILAAGTLGRACMLSADWTPLDRWIEALDALLTRATSGIEAEVLLSGTSRLVYLMMARQPWHAALSGWAARSISLLDAEVDADTAVMAGFSLLTYCTWTGQTADGDAVVRLVGPRLASDGLGAVSRAYWLWAEAGHLLRTGDRDDALRKIDRALELASQLGLTIAGVIRRHRIVHLLVRGQLDEAEAELAALDAAPRIEPYFELRSWLALCRGDPARARDEAQAALQQAEARGRTFYRQLDLELLATAHAASGNAGGAHEHLRAYRHATQGTPGEIATFQAALIEAFVGLRSGALAECRSCLARALETGARRRWYSAWGWHPAMMVPLLREALQQGIFVDYARTLIQKHRWAPDGPEVEGWPWPVKIRALGRFDVWIDEAALRFEGKAQHKPLELLKMLVAAGDAHVAIDRLIGWMWPDPEVGGRKAFDINVHRLRRLLRLDACVDVSDGRIGLDSRFVWVDAWALEHRLEPLRSSQAAAADASVLETLAPQVLDLYRGVLLADEPEAPWQMPMRTRLEARFRDFVKRLGAQWELTGQWDRAGQLYERVTELDPGAESVYQRRMVCLRAEGRRAEAREVYRRCRHVLAVTLGVAPSPETEALYRALLEP